MRISKNAQFINHFNYYKEFLSIKLDLRNNNKE